MAMKLSEQMRKSMDDAEDGLSFSFPVDAWANEVAQLEEGLLKYKDIAHNINESFQLERTENAALRQIKEAAQYEIDSCGFCKRGMECKASHAKLRYALLGETSD